MIERMKQSRNVVFYLFVRDYFKWKYSIEPYTWFMMKKKYLFVYYLLASRF